MKYAYLETPPHLSFTLPEQNRKTNLNYPKNYINGKETTLKLPSLELWKSQGIYRPREHQEGVTGPRVECRRAAPWYGHRNVVWAVLLRPYWRHATAPSGTHCRFVPLSVVAPGFWI